ncbi:hypothetical protein SPI_08967 [Niveomyces insectorum RCEF 264]|uniref:Microbial-type PARG catalytic domain-containing protein n=1 Tax=Niveomyces insectorum RCEF 264 TaxID=1081102 RepID=A0A167MH47_9HYPO|nr:hypothetical protein SPI_08967 [Niveomyces insectorum RCEF 264]
MEPGAHAKSHRPRPDLMGRARQRNRRERTAAVSTSTRRFRSGSPSSIAAPLSLPLTRIGATRPLWMSGQRERLRDTADETLRVLPCLLDALGTRREAEAAAQTFSTLSFPPSCPSTAAIINDARHPRRITLRVVNEDSLNAAIRLHRGTRAKKQQPNRSRPLVVNFANRHTPGGGWRNGAFAQEEELCYRSSLALSLHRDLYPLRHGTVLYSPYVVVVRSDRASGHDLLAGTARDVAVADLPVVSVVTVAALYRPDVRTVRVTEVDGGAVSSRSHPQQEEYRNNGSSNSGNYGRSESRDITSTHSSIYLASPPPPSAQPTARPKYFPIFYPPASRRLSASPVRRSWTPELPLPLPALRDVLVFAHERDRSTTKAKMRLTLRVAAAQGHRELVLGALGCGVFGNPSEDVARCWLEVLREAEFTGGHEWEEVVFAVYDGPPRSISDRQESQENQEQENRGGYRDRLGGNSNYAIFHRILDGQTI